MAVLLLCVVLSLRVRLDRKGVNRARFDVLFEYGIHHFVPIYGANVGERITDDQRFKFATFGRDRCARAFDRFFYQATKKIHSHLFVLETLYDVIIPNCAKRNENLEIY